MIYKTDIDQVFVEEVEAELGMGHVAWDCMDPAEIIAAAINVAVLKGLVEIA
jgi:hypothetical protein